MKRFAIGISVIAALLMLVGAVAATQLPAIGAGALLFPSRHVSLRSRPDGCIDRTFTGVGLTLDGWQCRSTNPVHQGTIIYLHGVADNRASGMVAIERFVPLGFDVVAYDSRAHGTSQGDRCTYGYFEKRDLQRVIDQLGGDRIIVIGHSLGAAVALQAAAIEPRIRGVVAASTFSDLRTIAAARAFGFAAWSLGPAFRRAERDGQFVVDDVSPVKAAADISVPVLLVHGKEDVDTPLVHSERVFEALHASKKLIVVPGAGHNDVLRQHQWVQVQEWIESVAQSGNTERK